ncbi:YhcG family protein [Gloeocapsa sp. PCC 73106]|uniref:PDDEXK nuclease domain-containing protein n=1 Tax=Gloeocapsa sp. PCC 73106 TaxID=102232 RepID=UPI0002AC10BD|nr:PDDEXK nuclease domain-containing protein [Gloeocapsa sp. PCC 73106]ELS00222.1 hypothetical protein GLO73106DRAFT_00040780 [Gloeocapsa sp. PCC 73106]
MSGKNNEVSNIYISSEYKNFLAEIKNKVTNARIKATLVVNRELIQLYWEIGRLIVEKQKSVGWGKAVIERLAKDLKTSQPEVKGFSARNLWRMKAFYEAYSNDTTQAKELKLPQAVAEIPWGHNIILLEKIKDPQLRIWYAQATIQHGWSRNILTIQIENQLHLRYGEAPSNFAKTLPSPQSDLVQQTIKDPYIFDFLTLADDAHERELEKGLVNHIRDFMLELGVGFAFVGNQYKITVADKDYYIDLLFYHLQLRCFVVIELKARSFIPEYAGKLNFYLSAIDDLLRYETDNPSIGIILCKSHDKITAEYALRDINKPIGIAEWQTQLVKSLPDNLKDSLPTIEELEEEFKEINLEEKGYGG